MKLFSYRNRSMDLISCFSQGHRKQVRVGGSTLRFTDAVYAVWSVPIQWRTDQLPAV